MFIKLVIRQLKIFLRDKSSMFWSSVFAIILAVFFKLALGNLGYGYKLDTMPVAYLNQDKKFEQFKSFEEVITSIENNGKKFIDIKKSNNNDEATNLLKKGEVEALIDISSPELNLIVNKSGIKQTIITSIMNAYRQQSKLIETSLAQNPQADVTKIVQTLSKDVNYFKPQANDHFDVAVMYFYTLIGMQCLYSYIWGLNFVTQNEANLSTKGQRIQVSSVKKSTMILSGFVASIFLAFIQILILLAFLVFGLKINFGNRIAEVILLLFVGSTTGVSFGTFVGAISKKSESIKNGIGIAITMLWSFLAGMMVVDIKYLIQQKAPLVNYFNPVSLVTDSLYGLYYYPTLDRYYSSLLMLSGITLFFLVVSIMLIRRKNYDSL